MEGRKVRVAGGTHSWANLFADQGGVLVNLVPGKIGGGRIPTFMKFEREVKT